MAAGPPITDQDRQQVAELHAAGRSRNQIAREIGRAASTVSKIAAAFDPPLSFERERTQKATAAKVADAKARRAALALALLGDAERLRRQMWAPATIYNFGGKDNDYNERAVDKPPFADQLKIMQTTGLAVDRHVRLVELDADAGVDDAKSMLTDLMGALGEAWRADQQPAAPDTQ